MNEETRNLFRWEPSKPRKNHNSKLNSKIKESDDIQSIHQWLRKVENASDKAITKVFDPNSKKANADQAASQSTLNSDPYSEAHDLINGWVADKIRLDMDDDFYNYVDVDEVNKFTTTENYLDKIKREIMQDEEEEDLLDIKGFDYDKYDEEYIARDIVNKMMKKKVVDTHQLAMDEPKRCTKLNDTQLKMELRHKAVKLNREKRQQEIEEKRKRMLEKKEIELKAKQMVEKEENDKKIRGNIEQQLLDQEVERLRADMAKKRREEEEIRKKQKEIELIRNERERQEILNIRKKLEIETIESGLEAKRSEIAEKRADDLVDNYLKTKGMRLIQTVFSAWYGAVMDNRLKIGKATALADWKLSFKVFNAWKKLNTTERLRRETEQHLTQVKYENIKNMHARNFYNANLIRKCMDEWRKFTSDSLIKKKLDEEKALTKNRMQKFLEAATDGKLWQTEENNEESTERPSARKPSQSSQIKQAKKAVRQKSARTNAQDLSEDELDLTKSIVGLEKKVKDLMVPWVKGQSKFDNRFKAQEKLMMEQHEMIKEQQKMIEEMKFQQNQVAFKEQIALLETIKNKQLELESMQKAQYQQEKKLLRQQAEMIRNKSKAPKTSENPGQLNLEDLASDDEACHPFQSPKSSRITGRIKVEKCSPGQESQLSSRRTIKTEDCQISSRSQMTSAATGHSKLNVFNRNMEERARQRELQRKEREEKKRLQEVERLELLRLQQAEKFKVEEEERQRKTEELREKRRVQKELEDKRNAEKIKEQKSNSIADDFYRKHLLRYYCMNGLKQLMHQRVIKIHQAETKYAKTILSKVTNAWRFHTLQVVTLKQEIADDFNHNRLLRTYFKSLKNSKQAAQISAAKATRHYKYRLKAKLFEAIRNYTTNEIWRGQENEVALKDHNDKRIVSMCFRMWKMFPAEMKRERERQKRLEDLRSKVREMIPDYDGMSGSQKIQDSLVTSNSSS